MKALERYVKKNGKADPSMGKAKPKGSWKGAKGIMSPDQYADPDAGMAIDDGADESPSMTGKSVMDSMSGPSKKKKQRSYLTAGD